MEIGDGLCAGTGDGRGVAVGTGDGKVLVVITPRGAAVGEGEAVGLVITSRGRVGVAEGGTTVWDEALIIEQTKTSNAAKTAFFINFRENRK